jgi:serine/threonine protein kinase
MPEPNVTKPVAAVLPRVVGGFRLVRELGRGGMGVVYHAEELSSGRVVALKVLAADQAVSEEAFERFRRESRMAASISDSRCVFVYGAHQVEGSPAIAMELCPGETLEHRLAKHEPIAIELAVRWTIEILEGLEGGPPGWRRAPRREALELLHHRGRSRQGG